MYKATLFPLRIVDNRHYICDKHTWTLVARQHMGDGVSRLMSMMKTGQKFLSLRKEVGHWANIPIAFQQLGHRALLVILLG